MRRFLRRVQRGDVWAFMAVVILFVGLPLASLTVDVVRGMYVRTHLQVATDAACQAAADALDAPTFIASGKRQIHLGLAYQQANAVFYSTLSDQAQTEAGFALTLLGPTTVHCQATAQARRILPLTPPMVVRVETTSDMRVVANP